MKHPNALTVLLVNQLLIIIYYLYSSDIHNDWTLATYRGSHSPFPKELTVYGDKHDKKGRRKGYHQHVYILYLLIYIR